MPSRNAPLAIALLACIPMASFAQDAMSPTTTIDPATQATPEMPVDPAQSPEPQSQLAPAQSESPQGPPPATSTPPTTPTSPGAPPARTGTGTGTVLMQDGQEIRINSHLPNSVVGDYRVDFAALDSNGDGFISRAEARANASLTAEFHVVDRNGDGRLSPEELSGWTR